LNTFSRKVTGFRILDLKKETYVLYLLLSAKLQNAKKVIPQFTVSAATP